MTITLDGTAGISTPPLSVQGSTSGSITFAAPAVAGTNTQTLVAATDTLAPIVRGTAVASTSGTSIDFTGIPSWVKRVTILCSGISKSSTANFLFQLGDSGGIETTGYTGQGGGGAAGNIFLVVTSTSGFPTSGDASGPSIVYGAIVFTNISGNTWISTGNFYTSIGYSTIVAGEKTLSATLDRVRITTTNGTDTFDAGSINILYE